MHVLRKLWGRWDNWRTNIWSPMIPINLIAPFCNSDVWYNLKHSKFGVELDINLILRCKNSLKSERWLYNQIQQCGLIGWSWERQRTLPPTSARLCCLARDIIVCNIDVFFRKRGGNGFSAFRGENRYLKCKYIQWLLLKYMTTKKSTNTNTKQLNHCPYFRNQMQVGGDTNKTLLKIWYPIYWFLVPWIWI